MKKLSLLTVFLLSFTFLFAQYPTTQSLGSDSTIVTSKGGLKGRIINWHYSDTTAANRERISQYPFAQISVGNYIWTRDSTATRWVRSTVVPIDTVFSDGIIQPGYVTWTGQGLIFNITSAIYVIGGKKYTSPARLDTLSPADATNSRIDLFVVDTTGHSGHITGIASPSPTVPQPAVGFQLALTSGLIINPGDTTPSGLTTTIVYDQNTEWTTGAQHGTYVVDFNNTANPYHLTKAAYLSKYQGTSLFFIDGAQSHPSNVTGTFDFWIYLKSAYSGSLYASFIDGSNGYAANSILITSDLGFNKSDSNQYQHIVIPYSKISWLRQQFNQVQLFFNGVDTSGSKGLYVDYLRLQNGITQVTPPTDYSNKVDSSTVVKLPIGTDTANVVHDWANGIDHPRKDTIWTGTGNLSSTKLNITDTTNKWVNNITKNATRDSFYVWKGNTYTALKDSVGTAGGTGGISKLGYPTFGLTRVNDSTYVLDTTNGATSKLRGDSLAAAISANTSSIATKLNITDTTGKWVTSLYRKSGSDSVFYIKNGSSVFAFRDSVGGGAATPDTIHVQNMGAGTTLAYTNGSDTLNVKNMQAGSNITLTQNSDSSITIASTGGGSTDTTSLSYRINSKQSIPLINTQSLNGLYNRFDTSSFFAGNITGQGLWTSSGTGSYSIVDPTLNISSSDGTGAILNRTFNEGEIILRVKTGSKYIVGWNYQSNGSRLAFWTPDGTHFTFGLQRGAGTTVDTVAITTLSTAASNIPSGKDYYLKLKIPAIGVATSLNWAIRDTGTAAYTNGTAISWGSRTDTLTGEGFITLGNLGTGTAQFYDIQVKDYNDNQNYLRTKATFIGNWFNHYETDSNTLATITAGSEIRYNVSGATSTTMSFMRKIAVASPDLQPYVDVTYRDMTTGGAWSAWHRDSVGDVTYTVATGLTASHTYQIRTVFDINENDSLWKYGNGIIVRDINVDAGQIYPTDVSTKPLIMAIGTSLTEGANQFTYSPIGPTNNLSYNNYLHVASDSLGAIPLNQGYGATGLLRDGSGGIPRSLTNLKYFKLGVKRNGLIPSLIIIEAGENDTYGGETTTQFINAYNQNIAWLKNTYPSAQIVLLRPFSGKLWTEVQSVAANNGLRTINTTGWSLTYTDGVHLDSASQRVAGDSIYHWIRDSIGVLTAPNKNYILPSSDDYVAIGVDRKTNNLAKIPSVISVNGGSATVSNNVNLFNQNFAYKIGGVNVLSAQPVLANFFGGNSGNTSATQIYNVSFGQGALLALTSGTGNTSMGSLSLTANTSGGYNTSIGYNSLLNNITGSYNVNVGYYGLRNNTAGSNTNVGSVGLFTNTTGANNTNVGYSGLNLNLTASNNTNVGYGGLGTTSTGGQNTNIGVQGLANGTTGDNTNVGYKGLLYFSTGQRNTNVGSIGGQYILGSNNTLMGYQNLANVNSPVNAGTFHIGMQYKITVVGTTDFTLIGASANTINTVFTATGVGSGTGTASLTTTATSNNTIIGYLAGQGLSYSANNTIIGANVTTATDSLSNNVIIADGSGNQRIQVTSIGVGNFFKGANVASATSIIPTGNLFHVTGTTNITSIDATNVNAGARITIIFDGILTFTDVSNLKLAGNFTTSADATITLVYDGTNFYETSRSVN